MTSPYKVVIIILMVVSMLTSARQQQQVLNAVIHFVTVAMMDLLASFEFAAKVLLHNIAVFVNLLTLYGNLAIAMARMGATFIIVVSRPVIVSRMPHSYNIPHGAII